MSSSSAALDVGHAGGRIEVADMFATGYNLHKFFANLKSVRFAGLVPLEVFKGQMDWSFSYK